MHLIHILALSAPLLASAQNCYYPDGSLATDYHYQLCTGDTYTTCCIPSEGDGAYPFRGACTDQSWSSDSCPKFCMGVKPYGWQELTQCGGGRYCCGGTGCCTDDSSVFEVGPGVVINDFGQEGISVPGTATATEAPSSTDGHSSGGKTTGGVSSAATATSTGSSGHVAGSTKVIAIGASVGAAIGLIFAAILAFFCYRHFNRKPAAPQPPPQVQQAQQPPQQFQQQQQQQSAAFPLQSQYPPQQQQPYFQQQQQQQPQYPPYQHQPPSQIYPPQQQPGMYSPSPTPAPPYFPDHAPPSQTEKLRATDTVAPVQPSVHAPATGAVEMDAGGSSGK
ncbi:hypothetical protein FGG08_002047 [Glutinoglossum americanum]|uniref:Uncharacterized protein n=1 Tax=Glutinoglossum americanum TaxID=1670608 RepID=A0A9P8ICA9_9PEZI|nr:hypothetical protein FGG08_002047 [Glutinoglossum americanum]